MNATPNRADGTIRPFTTIYGGTVIGDRFQTGQGVSIREDNVIGDDVSIGTNAVLEAGNRIGNRVRIHTGCFLELVTVEDDVFIAPNVVFADDPHPPCPSYEECVGGAVVKQGARIGSNATILPGVVIGREALWARARWSSKTFPMAWSLSAHQLVRSSDRRTRLSYGSGRAAIRVV